MGFFFFLHYTTSNIAIIMASMSVGQHNLTEWVSPKDLITKATNHNRRFMDYHSNGCGFMDYHSKGSLLASVWVDKRTIYFLSIMNVAEPPIGTTCIVNDGTYGTPG